MSNHEKGIPTEAKKGVEGGLSQETYSETLEEIEALENEQETKEFIDERVEKLTKESDPDKIISLLSNKQYKGFIHPKAEINRNFMLKPFRMNDNEMYKKLINKIDQFKEIYDIEDIRKVVPFAVQFAIGDYFGNDFSTSETVKKSENFYIERSVVYMEDEGGDVENGAIDLEEFKGKGIGVCAEKSAVAQNLASFLGMESHLITSNSCKLNEESGDAHMFNVFRTENGDFIYDASNPTFIVDSDDKIKSIKPSTYKLREGEFEDFMNGKGKEVTYKEINADTGKSIEDREQSFVYSI